MNRYLVVAQQTGDSPALLDKIRDLVRSDPQTEFVVLTPRRPLTMAMALAGETRTATQIALWRAVRTSRRLSGAGATVISSRLGGYDPLAAIEEELRSGDFTGVIIATLPKGISSWLHLDLPGRLRGRWPQIEVIQVTTSESSSAPSKRPLALKVLRPGAGEIVKR